MSHHLPSDQEIRGRIEAVEDEQTRMAFKYQYLIAGRISEVCGAYAPRGEDCFPVDFDGVLAVLFAVKTAKRRGRLRPVALPLSVDLEPWADQVREYFAYHRGEYPFRLHENWETSKTYAMKRATEALRGLEWPMIEYTRTAVKPVEEEEILDVRIDNKGREMYLVSEAGGKKWYARDEEGYIRYGVKIPNRWKHATSHVLRKRRTVTLLYDYEFSGIELALYGGWTLQSQAENMPQALKHYLYLDMSASTGILSVLKKQAKRYFPKLLRKP